MKESEKKTIDSFHELYFNGLEGETNSHLRTLWMGFPCQKCPLDLWIYQEIFAEIRPDLIVEAGTFHGGSALYMAHVLDVLGKGEIITIDVVERSPRPIHPRIRYVTGSSGDGNLIDQLLCTRPNDEVRLVILDSDHSKNHVSQELRLLAPFVTIGSYLIVEDTCVNGHPILQSFGDDPFEAVEEFLKTNTNFIVDSSREKLLLTYNPNGFLKRIG